MMYSSFLRLGYIGWFVLSKFTIFVDYGGFGHYAFAGFCSLKNEVIFVISFETEAAAALVEEPVSVLLDLRPPERQLSHCDPERRLVDADHSAM
jgi:hypothetical protein